MKIRELETAFRKGIRAYPGRPALALVTDNGALSASIPAEFADAASTLAGRSGKTPGKGGIIFEGHRWA